MDFFCHLSGANLKGAVLDNSQMNGINLRLASLKGASLRSCNLRYAIMAGTDLEVSGWVGVSGSEWMGVYVTCNASICCVSI